MSGELLTRREIAHRFRVHPQTVRDWAENGALPRPIRTLGGHYRYRADEIPGLPPEGDELLTAPEVATLLGVGLKTVHQRVEAGELPAVRTPGSHLRFLSSQVWELLTGMRQGAGTEESR